MSKLLDFEHDVLIEHEKKRTKKNDQTSNSLLTKHYSRLSVIIIFGQRDSTALINISKMYNITLFKINTELVW